MPTGKITLSGSILEFFYFTDFEHIPFYMYDLPASLSFCFERRALLSYFGFVFEGLYFACTRMTSSSIYCTASTSQHHRANRPFTWPLPGRNKYVPIEARQARRQSWQEPACRRAFVQLAQFSKRTKTSESAQASIYCVFVLARTLGSCNSTVCMYSRGPLFPLHLHLVCVLMSGRSGRRLPAECSAVYCFST